MAAKLDKLVVVVGTTASGKSGQALEMAQAYNGEIIAADSRTIYKGMDIGTAKPSIEDQRLVPHHLLDLIEPDQKFSVAEFQTLANRAIEDIQNRGKLPILVGGTGLYIDAVIYNYSFRQTDPKIRKQLEALTIEELHQKIDEAGLDLPENAQNKRHLIRVLESNGQASKKQPLRPNTLVLGIGWPSEVLKQRIAQRVQQMLDMGLEQEVTQLVQQYGWNAEAMKGIGYREWKAYFDKNADLITTREAIITDTWQYARRQRTWFKRNQDIHWLNVATDDTQSLSTL